VNSESLLLSKLKFARHWRPTHHRSGWGYAMDALDCLHCEEGTFLDGFAVSAHSCLKIAAPEQQLND
jgi:hypothetical protein